MNVRSSLVLASAAAYGSAILSLGAMLVVSRLLTPAEFGLYAIALAAANLLNVLRDGGVGAYIIQHKQANMPVLRAAFTATSIFSLLCATGLILIAPWAGVFYGAVEVTHLVWITAFNAILTPFSIVVTAELERAMRFKAVLWLQLLTAAAGAFISVALVGVGFGVYGLALGTTAASVVNVGYCLWVVDGYRRFRPQLKGVWPVLRFSSAAATALALRQLDRDALALVIGRAIGAAPVGQANRAGALLNIYERLTAGLYTVIFPAFADIRRRGNSLAGALIHGLALISVASMLVFSFLAITAEPALVFLFGEQWRPAARLVAPLAAVALVGQALERMATPAYLALGRIDIPMKINAVLLVVKLSILLVAAPFGLETAVWALLIYAVIAFSLDLVVLPQVTGLSRTALVRTLATSALIAAPAVIVGLAADGLMRSVHASAFVHLMGVGAPYAAAAWISLRIFDHPLSKEIIDAVARLRRRSKAGAQPKETP